MSSPQAPGLITSRDNPLVKELRRLSEDSVAYRKYGHIWIEGEHLCRAALKRGVAPVRVILSESADPADWMIAGVPTVVLSESLMREVSTLESPASVGFLLPLPESKSVLAGQPTVILDRLQDVGNVGSILRSAAAFGVQQVVALKGTAALWGPKVVRAGMGAHFGLQLVEGVELGDLDGLDVPIVVTSSHHGLALNQARIPFPCAWVLGHEGQGIRPELAQRAALEVRIPQPGGEESLNVAAAAAICLYAGSANAPERAPDNGAPL